MKPSLGAGLLPAAQLLAVCVRVSYLHTVRLYVAVRMSHNMAAVRVPGMPAVRWKNEQWAVSCNLGPLLMLQLTHQLVVPNKDSEVFSCPSCADQNRKLLLSGSQDSLTVPYCQAVLWSCHTGSGAATGAVFNHRAG
jgi:hypothetical protein